MVAWMAKEDSAAAGEAAAAISTERSDRRKGGGPRAARDRPPRERVERPGIEDADPGQVRPRALREFQAADTNGGFLPDEARKFPVITKEFARVDVGTDASPQEFVKLRR
jgi:hypothetical protein